MDQFFDALRRKQEGTQQEILKGFPGGAPEGTVHTWKDGRKFKKQGGTWVPVSEGKGGKKEEVGDGPTPEKGQVDKHQIAQLTQMKELLSADPAAAYEIFKQLPAEGQHMVPQDVVNKMVKDAHAAGQKKDPEKDAFDKLGQEVKKKELDNKNTAADQKAKELASKGKEEKKPTQSKNKTPGTQPPKEGEKKEFRFSDNKKSFQDSISRMRRVYDNLKYMVDHEPDDLKLLGYDKKSAAQKLKNIEDYMAQAKEHKAAMEKTWNGSSNKEQKKETKPAVKKEEPKGQAPAEPDKRDINYQLTLMYTGRNKPRLQLQKKAAKIWFGYKVNPKQYEDTFNEMYPNKKFTHKEWVDKPSGGGTHVFTIEDRKGEEIKKGQQTLPIGTKRMHGGVEMEKTAKGWEPVRKDPSKQTGAKFKLSEVESQVPGYLMIPERKKWQAAKSRVDNFGKITHYNKAGYDQAERDRVAAYKEYKTVIIAKYNSLKAQSEKLGVKMKYIRQGKIYTGSGREVKRTDPTNSKNFPIGSSVRTTGGKTGKVVGYGTGRVYISLDGQPMPFTTSNIVKTAMKKSIEIDLEKGGRGLPVGTVNKYGEMKMSDGTWKYVGKKGANHPKAQMDRAGRKTPKADQGGGSNYAQLEDAIQIARNSYTVDKITQIDTTPKGNYRVYIDGKDIGLNINKDSAPGREAAKWMKANPKKQEKGNSDQEQLNKIAKKAQDINDEYNGKTGRITDAYNKKMNDEWKIQSDAIVEKDKKKYQESQARQKQLTTTHTEDINLLNGQRQKRLNDVRIEHEAFFNKMLGGKM